MENLIPQILFLSLIFLLSLTLSYRKRMSRSTTATASHPPSPPKLPIIGHLHLLTDLPHHDFAKLADKLGPIFYLQLGHIPTVVISSTKFAKFVFKTHDQVFATRPQTVGVKFFSFGGRDVSMSPFGPYWRQARKIFVNELLSSKRVNSFQVIRDNEVNRLLTSVKNQCGEVTDMSNLFFTLANDILCLAAFGKRYPEGSEEEEGRKSNLMELLREGDKLLSGFHLAEFYPDWGWLNLISGYGRRLTKSSQVLKIAFDEIINEHLKKKQAQISMDGEDFIDVLLRVQRQHDLEVPITHEDVMALVMDVFTAGTVPTSTTTEWIMTELARHPTVMKKAQEEVRKVTCGSKRVDETHIHQLYYLKAVIKEGMRLHPPNPFLVDRESLERCMIDGYDIPPKTRIIINNYAISRHPNSWENPLQFIPERFIENNTDFIDQNFRFFPFGGGRRVCPGYNFALATVELTLARLLYHFDWALPPGVGPDDVDIQESFAIATRKKSALLLVPTTNKDYEFK